VDDGVSLLDKSQPVHALFPDPEPVDKTQRELAPQEPNLHPLQFPNQLHNSKYQLMMLKKSKYNLMNLMMILMSN
jgi:hypothetical protein